MDSTQTGRSFGVSADGTLYPIARHFDSDLATFSSQEGKPPMKVIMPRASAESLKKQLRVPSSRIRYRNINDSVNLNDFLEYGAKTSSKSKGDQSNNNMYQTRNYDVRKWI